MYKFGIPVFCFLSLLVHTSYASTLDKVKALNLSKLENGITTYYSNGTKERALRVRGLIGGAISYFKERSYGETPDLYLAVLNKSDWEQVIPMIPYGMPMVSEDKPYVAFLPASDDNVITQIATYLVANFSESMKAKLKAAGIDPDEAAKEFVDLVSLHELGHTYTFGIGVQAHLKWFHELSSTYFAYEYLTHKLPKDGQIWDLLLEGFREVIIPTYHSLEDFEELYVGVGLVNFIWYHSMFQLRVHELIESEIEYVSLVTKLFNRNPTYDTRRLLNLLEENVAAGFQEWAQLFE